MINVERVYERTKPSNGAMNIKAIIFITPGAITELNPELVIAAPIRPPTRVWEELEGKPHHHVSKFQIIAATVAAAITLRLIASGLTTPKLIVEATLRWNIKNAMNLKNAAINTAAIGERTLVDTTQAMEFAES